MIRIALAVIGGAVIGAIVGFNLVEAKPPMSTGQFDFGQIEGALKGAGLGFLAGLPLGLWLDARAALRTIRNGHASSDEEE